MRRIEAVEAMIITDPQGVVLDWTRGAEHLWGWRAREAIGEFASELLHYTDPTVGVVRAREWKREPIWRGSPTTVRGKGSRSHLVRSVRIPIEDAVVWVSYACLDAVRGLPQRLPANGDFFGPVDTSSRGRIHLPNASTARDARGMASPISDAEPRMLSEEEEREHVGYVIRTAREAEGLSKGALARLIGVTTSDLRRYERGEHMPGLIKLIRLAKALNIPLESFKS